MILYDILIAGHVMIGPKLCQIDILIDNKLKTYEYVCNITEEK